MAMVLGMQWEEEMGSPRSSSQVSGEGKGCWMKEPQTCRIGASGTKLLSFLDKLDLVRRFYSGLLLPNAEDKAEVVEKAGVLSTNR